MDCEVVVVGGGIGGLTVAALLAKRGVNVCLLERESRVGGCAASFEKFGYTFEQGDGLYTSWQPRGIHDQIYSELGVEPPEVRLLEPSYIVRLPDSLEVSLTADELFEENLREVFRECADQAISFYRELSEVSETLERVLEKAPDFFAASSARQALALLSAPRSARRVLKRKQQITADHLAGTSSRFRYFIDIQLQVLAQGSSAEVSYLYSAVALTDARKGMFAIRGGPAALAETLAHAIKTNGGRIRLDTPVLRLSYDSSGAAKGVDLLSGETVTASKAIVSNLTVWDTYGKLVGLNRTPLELRRGLKSLTAWGAYLIYVGVEENLATNLSSERFMLLTGEGADQNYSPSENQLLFSVAPGWDPRAPVGKRAATIHALTEVDEWFTFHQDETEVEAKDQQRLEQCWRRLHEAMPELGSGVEVMDTATPRTFYESTRRKLGLVCGPAVTPDHLRQNLADTFLPNLFVVSDTLAPGGIAGVSQLALRLANQLSS